MSIGSALWSNTVHFEIQLGRQQKSVATLVQPVEI